MCSISMQGNSDLVNGILIRVRDRNKAKARWKKSPWAYPNYYNKLKKMNETFRSCCLKCKPTCATQQPPPLFFIGNAYSGLKSRSYHKTTTGCEFKTH